ncbi:MAG: signal peptidase I [Candidatus Acidiferrales bacterium]
MPAPQPEPSPALPERAAPPPEAPRARRSNDGAWEAVRSLLIVLVGVFCIRTFVGEATMIPTGSMRNTILIGDHVFLDKLLYGPSIPYTSWRLPRLADIKHGDIVAFRYPRNPSELFVKRVIGEGGDVIRVVDKRVYLNGKPLEEPYVRHSDSEIFPLRDNFPPPVSEIESLPESWGLNPIWASQMPEYIESDGLHVPKGFLFVMGDNRDDSSDSRFWGFVPLKNVVGEPAFVYWSYNAPSKDWLDDTMQGQLRFDGSIFTHFVQKTRWSRIGKIFKNPDE